MVEEQREFGRSFYGARFMHTNYYYTRCFVKITQLFIKFVQDISCVFNDYMKLLKSIIFSYYDTLSITEFYIM
jgi:hypothetical protein